MGEATTHSGGCQCGRVAFEVDSDLDGLIECNCSHCYRKGLVLKFVPVSTFRLLRGADDLSQHTFNQHRIRHRFCRMCGVQSFAEGQGPDGQAMMAINVRTLTDLEPWSWTAERVDGRSF
jgi:hypothetical protein